MVRRLWLLRASAQEIPGGYFIGGVVYSLVHFSDEDGRVAPGDKGKVTGPAREDRDTTLRVQFQGYGTTTMELTEISRDFIKLAEPVCRPGTSTPTRSGSAAPPRPGKTGLSTEAEATLYALADNRASLVYQLVECDRIKRSAAKHGYYGNVAYNLRSGYENLPGGAVGNVYDLLADLNLANTPENQKHAHIYAEISSVREEIYASTLTQPDEETYASVKTARQEGAYAVLEVVQGGVAKRDDDEQFFGRVMLQRSGEGRLLAHIEMHLKLMAEHQTVSACVWQRPCTAVRVCARVRASAPPPL